MSCREQGLSRCSINARPRARIIFLPLSDACSAWKRSGRDDETRYTNPLSISTVLRDFLVLRWPRMLLVHCFNLVTNVLHVTTLRFLVHYLAFQVASIHKQFGKGMSIWRVRFVSVAYCVTWFRYVP